MKDFIDSILYNVNKIITYDYSIYELILNVSFIIIIFVILYIVYYYYINNKAFQNSTCKSTININNNDDYYYLFVKDNNDNDLYNIKYNMKNKKPTIECACKPGNVINNFTNIKLYDKNNSHCHNNIDNKYACNCDNDYSSDNPDLLYSGDPFLVNYMNNNNKNLEITDNTIKNKCLLDDLVFPDPI